MIDLLLVCGLWSLALTTLLTPNAFRALVFFILLGLLLTLVWIRLDAPDIALAEAALGTGITGVLLLDTLKQQPQHALLCVHRTRIFWAVFSGLSLTLALSWALLQAPAMPIALDQTLTAQLDASGVSHPITAVLLNFRAYDTLLEIGVLLLALFAGQGLHERQHPLEQLSGAQLHNPFLRASLALWLPGMLLLATYLLWAGAHQPGGAFQAGAVLAAAFILMHLCGLALDAQVSQHLLRIGVLVGFVLFLVVASSSMLAGQTLLTYPSAWAGELILLIELALTFSIGLILFSLFTLNHQMRKESA
ncbi:hydrogenase subunit MbhD domain-containing protein [Nitrincola tapanii]|nr:hydrogenase subunit MbhD domain-containing protein [Nitrincola tapanii]